MDIRSTTNDTVTDDCDMYYLVREMIVLPSDSLLSSVASLLMVTRICLMGKEEAEEEVVTAGSPLKSGLPASSSLSNVR